MSQRPQRRSLVVASLLLCAVAGCWWLLPGEPARAPLPPDRSTPRRALEHFIVSCRAGDVSRAAEDLDLSRSSPEQRAAGPLLARRLKFVLDQRLWITWDAVSDAPGAPGATEVLGEIPLDGVPVPIVLGRQEAPGGGARWKFVPDTVSSIDALHARYGPPAWLDARMPAALTSTRFLELEAWQWLGLLLLLATSWAGGTVGAYALLLLRHAARRTAFAWDDRLIEAARAPLRFLLMLLLLEWLADPLRLAAPAHEVISGVRSVLLAATTGWLCVRMVGFVAATLEAALTSGMRDEAQARGVRTQVSILRRIAAVIVTVVACALILTRFEVVRTVGMSLLASAGIAGIVIGLAAQRSIAALLAGIQLSITQPIRIGDTVIVDGEWGWIEEIHLTYVVLKVWDLRRLIVPINKFLEAPFQNWTRASTEIMGTVELYADYATPVDAVRAEVRRVCEASPNWDKKVAGLQVTDVSPQTMTLRALVSSTDAGKNWDLRCEVREALVRFLKGLDGGQYLPRARVDRAAGGDDPASPATDGGDTPDSAPGGDLPDVALIATAAALGSGKR